MALAFACWGGAHTGHSHRKAKGESLLRPRLLSWDGTRERCLRPRVELGGQSVRPTPVNSTWTSHYFWRCRFGNYGASPRFQGKSAPRFDWAPPGVVCATPTGLGIRSCPGRGPRSKDHLRTNAGALSSHED